MKESWDDCSGDIQARIIAFDQVASHDEDERDAHLAGAGKPSSKSKAAKPSKGKKAR